MLTRNQEIIVKCTGLGPSFEGICRVNGQVVFVEGALPGERVRATIIKSAKRYAIARLEQVLTPSRDRILPACPYYPQCGGCTAQHLRYALTLTYKRQQVVDCLERIGRIRRPAVRRPLGMENPWRYRNKGTFPVGGEAGSPLLGMYAPRSHRIVDTPEGCLLQSVQSDALLRAVRQWMTAYDIEPYEEKAHAGLVRHVVIREAANGEMMLVLVVNGSRLPYTDALTAFATNAVPTLRSIILCENTDRTNVVFGDSFTTLWGEDTLPDAIAGFSMRVSPRSFFQINRPQAEILYAQTLAYAALSGGERVWDLYCGAGSITLPLAANAAHVTGVEIVEDAIADARVNASANGVHNVDFVAGAVEKVLPSLLASQGSPSVVVLDPPRKGCEPAALEAILHAAPGRIVYVSCNPASLARDVGILVSGGYTVQEVQPVDMFGWTGHVECVALLVKDAAPESVAESTEGGGQHEGNGL